MSRAWNVDAPVATEATARTFTADVTDPDLILMQAPYLVDRITITFHVPDTDAEGNPVAMPAVDGETLLIRTKIAGS